MIFSSDVLKRWSFQKGLAGIWSFLYYPERWYFFFPKTWFFSYDGKWKMIFLEKYMEIWHPLYVRVGATYVIPRRSAKKESKMTFSRKNTPKGVVDKLDWHSRKSSNNFMLFYGDLYRRFHILLSSQTNPGNLIYRIEVWLLLQFIQLEIFYSGESSMLCTIQPSGVVFGGLLERKSRKLFVH